MPGFLIFLFLWSGSQRSILPIAYLLQIVIKTYLK